MINANFIVDPNDLKNVIVYQPTVIQFINTSNIDI